ncbi:MAG: carboxypeptidase-like regulatory domain-containing protein [Terracidiphilus sp.]
MNRHGLQRTFLVALAIGSVLAFASHRAMAQAGTEGRVVVTAEDASGAVVPGATLTLVNHQTNDTYTASTNGTGSYTFVNLPIGTYGLTISRTGYATRIYSAVIVEAAQVTNLTAQLSVGKTTQTIRVADEGSVLQTTSNAIGNVIDVKQIQDLPLDGRNVNDLISSTPGYSGQGGSGTFNGLPLTDQGSNMDGMVGNTSRMKFDANGPAVEPRLENIEQMSVQTDQLNLNSGFGQATTQVNFVSKRGSNHFHGLVYEDFRNDGLNANSWVNNALGNPKGKQIENDFGGSIGGPILHNKFFFFGTFTMRRIPGSYLATNDVFTNAAQSGNFTYVDSNGVTQTANLLTIAQNSGLNIPSTVNSEVASQFTAIDSSLSSGHLAGTPDPNYQELAWNNPSPEKDYYPVARLDYNPSRKARMYLSWMMTQTSTPGTSAPTFPGSGFADQVAGNQTKNFTTSYGLNYIFSPHLINQFKAGYLYDATAFAYNSAPLYVTEPTVAWNYPGATGNMSGQNYQLPIDTYYPIWDFSDSMTLQRGKHTFDYGVSWYKEQDHYWNAPGGFYQYGFGLATGDPAINAFTNSGANPTLPNATNAELTKADALYAILTGRLNSVNGENSYNIKDQKYAATGTMSEYPLDEVSSAWSFFAEDSWQVTPTLTFNYGLRWDIFGAEKDLTGFYHSADEASIYGPTAVGDLFDPGSLKGNLNPTLSVHAEPYAPWRITPQPAFGFAWNPRPSDGVWKTLLGGSNTVIRGGYALRRFTEPYQYFWDAATDFGQFYYQQFYILPNNSGQPGTFAPGSLAIGDTLPTFSLSPSTYEASAPESEFTFAAPTPTYGIEPNLREPYSESWNLGIQRGLGSSRVLEVRYMGNRTLHQWIMIDPNEVNVFENGFLKDFKNAQANLAASGGNSFSSSYGNPTPILDAAFGGSGASDYTNTQFINYLNTGQVGSLANVIQSNQGTVQYFCNLVGAGFSPCATNQGYTGAGAGYPINMFVANPYAAYTGYYYGPENSTGELSSAGYSNYNGLQVDLRQASWHGLQYDANYTWSKSLGLESGNQWTGAYNAFTLRNLRRSYGPTLFDIRNVLHTSGTYDIPVGRGRTYLSHSRVLDAVLGGYTVGSIVTWQGGAPALLGGGYNTYNDYADGGVQLQGVTTSQLQSSMGVRQVAGQPYANFLDPKYLVSPSGGGANASYIAPNITPGTFGQLVYLHGPRQFFQDMELTKTIPIHETMNFTLQASFINVWNHPVFGNTDGYGPYVPGVSASSPSFDSGVQDYNFGEGSPTNEGAGFGRQIELRGNFRF